MFRYLISATVAAFALLTASTSVAGTGLTDREAMLEDINKTCGVAAVQFDTDVFETPDIERIWQMLQAGAEAGGYDCADLTDGANRLLPSQGIWVRAPNISDLGILSNFEGYYVVPNQNDGCVPATEYVGYDDSIFETDGWQILTEEPLTCESINDCRGQADAYGFDSLSYRPAMNWPFQVLQREFTSDDIVITQTLVSQDGSYQHGACYQANELVTD